MPVRGDPRIVPAHRATKGATPKRRMGVARSACRCMRSCAARSAPLLSHCSSPSSCAARFSLSPSSSYAVERLCETVGVACGGGSGDGGGGGSGGCGGGGTAPTVASAAAAAAAADVTAGGGTGGRFPRLPVKVIDRRHEAARRDGASHQHPALEPPFVRADGQTTLLVGVVEEALSVVRLADLRRRRVARHREQPVVRRARGRRDQDDWRGGGVASGGWVVGGGWRAEGGGRRVVGQSESTCAGHRRREDSHPRAHGLQR